jgi:hypothetical protein
VGIIHNKYSEPLREFLLRYHLACASIRRAVPFTQGLASDEELYSILGAQVYAEKPKKDIYDFIGNFILPDQVSCSLFQLRNIPNKITILLLLLLLLFDSIALG